ncbi:hypothetical protein [Salinimonas sediminis]|uniref:Uncharacterized protein n=1 Tax=Salinimonas sediminis TaxID=2303538 RepID=A0A346NMA5_9ALTE|nr:hypothetical protein [Salinimonas sediminis]AXR06662.1 hypothetical protein D0Y50_09930 [Salinimonas sediminis]
MNKVLALSLLSAFSFVTNANTFRTSGTDIASLNCNTTGLIKMTFDFSGEASSSLYNAPLDSQSYRLVVPADDKFLFLKSSKSLNDFHFPLRLGINALKAGRPTAFRSYPNSVTFGFNGLEFGKILSFYKLTVSDSHASFVTPLGSLSMEYDDDTNKMAGIEYNDSNRYIQTFECPNLPVNPLQKIRVFVRDTLEKNGFKSSNL